MNNIEELLKKPFAELTASERRFVTAMTNATKRKERLESERRAAIEMIQKLHGKIVENQDYIKKLDKQIEEQDQAMADLTNPPAAKEENSVEATA